MNKVKKLISVLLAAVMILGMLPAISMSAAAEGSFMEITSGNYLSTVGSNVFNVFMYDNTFSGTFGDQHMGGIELSLSGMRIATNGDIHYLPTPEQWDATPAPSRGSITRDRDTNTITVPMTFNGSPDGTLRYNLVASPTETGVKLQVVLTSPMPNDLIGKARFNLEFLPLCYRNKSYQADLNGDGIYDDFGSFPLHPKDELEQTERPNLPTQAWYVQDWNEDRGNAQPLPFATGYGFTFAPEDPDYSITITSKTDDGLLELFDGRNRAQNGWYVLSTLINKGDQGDVVAEWDITPNVDKNWIRKPNVGFSQVGYSPEQEKFAVVELDKWDENYPKEIKLLRVNADGSEDVVKTGTLGEPTAWLRYKDVRFDFTEVKDVGLYRIEYAGEKGEVFPIAKDVYDNIWQTALDGFLTVAMDHMEVREGYKIWHGAAHMDDASIGDRSSSWFDGMSMQTMPQAIRDKGYKGEDHVTGLNKGGWYDAGDFDLQISRNVQVWGTIVSTAQGTNNLDNYDTLTVTWDDETGGSAEMHRPDGIPDIVQHAVHGAKQILAEYEELGGTGGTMEVRSLRQYTHLGDPSSDTDGYIYDPNLKEEEIVERDGKIYSGRADDRYFLTAGGGGSFSAGIGNHYINFAATAALAVPYEPLQDYAKHLFEVALTQVGNASSNWNALVQFTLAAKAFKEAGVDYAGSDTYTYEYFKELFDAQVDSHLGVSNNISIFACKDLMTAEQWAQLGQNVKASADSQTESTEVYGLRPYQGASWGNSVGAYSGQTNNAIMYYNFPEEGAGFKQNLLRAVNYVMGRHPVTNASYISGVGTKSALHPYNSNRGDESFIPGSVLPGHITFNDFAESMDDFSFLWFENESIINYQSSWLAVGFAAGKMAQNEGEETYAPTKDFASNFDAKLVTKTTQSAWGGGSSTDGYLADKGFNMLMYSTTFDRTFGDQHCAGIELIQNGRRVATNGDIHLLPTPEQWDATPPPTRGTREFDEETGKVTINMTLPKETVGDPDPTEPQTVDKTALNAAIEAADALKESDYTAESWAAMQTALTAAKAQQASATATQTAVNAATQALNDAVAALVKAGPAGDAWVIADEIKEGIEYLIVADAKYALTNKEASLGSYGDGGNSLASAEVTVEDGVVTSEVTDDMIWTFADASKDLTAADGQPVWYVFDADGKYMHRTSGSTSTAPLRVSENKHSTTRYNTWTLKPYESEDPEFAMYCATERAAGTDYPFHLYGRAEGFDAPASGQRSGEDDFSFMNESDCSHITLYTKGTAPEPEVLDKTKLEAALEAAGKVDKTKYTAATVKALEDAVAAGQKALTSAKRQSQLDAAEKAITDAIAALKEKEILNYTDIDKAIADAKAADTEGCTPASVKALTDALAAAEKAKAEAETQAELDAAAAALKTAINGLSKLDKSAVQAAIEAAEKLDLSEYTEESAKAVTDALAAAKNLLENATAQAALDKAASDLNAAINALVPKGSTQFEFDDVKDPSKFYYDPVYWAVNHDPQITNGATPTTFNPDGACTRGHVVTFLWRAAGEPEPTSSNNPFTDLKETGFYYKAVLWAVEKGITTGTSKTTFAPGKPCTRGQIVTFLWRYKNSPEPTTTENPFSDVKEAGFYYKAVLWAVENNVTSGTGKGKFSPDSTCTRGQVVTFLYRASGEAAQE